jgi:hypothetical protein
MNTYAKLIIRLQPNGRRLLQQKQQPAGSSLPSVNQFRFNKAKKFDFSLGRIFYKTIK